MFLFASVLAEFFALYATVNSFHELVVQGMEKGEEYRWQARVGNQPLI
jgi:type VI secretion system protein ImpG